MQKPILELADHGGTRNTRASVNSILPEDRAIHDWYRFVLSYPPHLVRSYIDRFQLDGKSKLLDPFCGTGTTLVEAKKQGVPSCGVEAVPLAHLASKVKVQWRLDPDLLVEHAKHIASLSLNSLQQEGFVDDANDVQSVDSEQQLKQLPQETGSLLLKDSISPLPLHKVLTLLEHLEKEKSSPFFEHEQLALAKVLPTKIGNLRFGPEVGIGTCKQDAPVVDTWLKQVECIAEDLKCAAMPDHTGAEVIAGDSRNVEEYFEPNSISAVICSPPYPNEKDYLRIVRLESVLLGLINSQSQLQSQKRRLVRSNTRGVYKTDSDDGWIKSNRNVLRIAEEIESRRLALGKTSGFERAYHRVTKLYFGGMAKHFHSLSKILKPGARLAYVVGDQASYLRVMIRTSKLLAEIASTQGYEVEGIDLFRTRQATATRSQLREEVLLLRWPGNSNGR